MGDPRNLARRESTDPGSCAALAKRWRTAREIFSEGEEGDEIAPFEHGMAERRHPFERAGVAAREPLPPLSKKIFRGSPGGNRKQGNDEVPRHDLPVFHQENLPISSDDRGDEMHVPRGRPPRSPRSRSASPSPSWTATLCAFSAASRRSGLTRRLPRRSRGFARSPDRSCRCGVRATSTRPSWSLARSSARRARRAAAPARSGPPAARPRAGRRRRSRERRGDRPRDACISSPRSSKERRGFCWLKIRSSSRATSSCLCFAFPPGNALKIFLEKGGSGSRAATPPRSKGWRRSAIPCSNGGISSPSSLSEKIFRAGRQRFASAAQLPGSVLSLRARFPGSPTADCS